MQTLFFTQAFKKRIVILDFFKQFDTFNHLCISKGYFHRALSTASININLTELEMLFEK